MPGKELTIQNQKKKKNDNKDMVTMVFVAYLDFGTWAPWFLFFHLNEVEDISIVGIQKANVVVPT